MRILGIDPGSRITGYGVIERVIDKKGTHYRCLEGGSIILAQASKTTSFPERLGKLFRAIQELIALYQPHEMAIEQAFLGKNVQSALKLGHARGVVMAAVQVQPIPIPVFEYAPRLVKKSVVGTGAADKIQVQHMVKNLLQLNQSPQADCADALAIALCHAYHRNHYNNIRVAK